MVTYTHNHYLDANSVTKHTRFFEDEDRRDA